MAAFAEDSDYEEVPDEEKLAIATHFLLSSPPGEIADVLADVKVVCSEHLLTDGVLSGIFRKYNTTNQQVIDADDGTKLLVCKQAEVDSTHIIDPASKQVYKINHIALTATLDEDVEYPESPLEEYRVALQKEMHSYVKRQYGKDSAMTTSYCAGDAVVVKISGEKLNLRNFWSGRWASEWTVKPGDANVEGNVHILVHYFEDGNVQMVTDKNVDTRAIKHKSATDLAQQVVDFVSDQEGKIQASMEDMYRSMGQETFKDMRRILPISKQKMDWSGAQMNIAKAFSGGAGSSKSKSKSKSSSKSSSSKSKR